MRLALIYINYHEYLIKKPQVINLGGQYLYTAKKEGKEVVLNRSLNEDFIEGFFDTTGLDSKLVNLNAIVGQNGAGKSSIFDAIRSLFIESPYALPSNNTYLFFETNVGNELATVNSIWDVGEEHVNFITYDNSFSIARDRTNSKFKTIYYSPHFDYRYNPKFDNIDNYDISFDKIVQEDLQDLQNKTPTESGWNYSVSQELSFKNSLRQISFLSSDIVVEDNIFKNLFDFPKFGEARLLVSGYRSNDEWNTPRAFRATLNAIKKKLTKEIEDSHLQKRYKEVGRVSNQIDVNKYLLKRYILASIISILERQMEKSNDYLSKGEFIYETFVRDSRDSDAYDSFLLFIKNSKLRFGSEEIGPFLHEPILKLLEKLYTTIDALKNEESVETKVFFVPNEDAITILKYQREFLINVINYYASYDSNKKKKNKIVKSNLIDGFINYMPSKSRLSSGEQALLNFFSRLFDFLNSKLNGDTSYLNEAEHYLLLLDEADLGFHPVWKKKFVNSIIKTIPYFFNILDQKPSFQILFTTHDPLTLSDLPNKNIVYLKKDLESGGTEVLEYDNILHPSKSFAANITDLLADSFFVEEGLLGDFAKEKINKTIDWLRDKEEFQNSDYHKKIIQIIDEPIVQQKLSEMYSEKMNVDFSKEILSQQIESLKQKFKNQTGNDYDSL